MIRLIMPNGYDWASAPDARVTRYLLGVRRTWSSEERLWGLMSAEDRELLPIRIDDQIAVLRQLVAAHPRKAVPVETIIARLEAFKARAG
ncbi:MAG: hypothetical protein HY834_08820 [Devosia nanyangense]|uniref:Uncharacterized protein n=1 Tax=Devosia nanyangense TaxID=1228055 RepID=A0A933L0Q3_9HYPH|nr:hypothetical protein [Devosia nanyangense]